MAALGISMAHHRRRGNSIARAHLTHRARCAPRAIARRQRSS